ncbi:helix-turn-helix domain-containing protein [Paenibacillus sp. NPDC058177]|uniref:helix-turn-helix domain-containing protein n=1 Tax=Paenibacillus sp. NPDC058177 TaxID=3346369 RepID=UPI0036DF8D45
MSVQPSRRPARLSIMYTWSQIYLYTLEEGAEGLTICSHAEKMLVVPIDGSAEVYSDEQRHVLYGNHCGILDPKENVSIQNAGTGPLRLYLIEFDELRLPGSSEEVSAERLPITAGVIELASFSHFSGLVHNLYERRDLSGLLEEYESHFIFQEILLMILKSAECNREQDATSAVQKTIAFMENAYAFDLTHGQLAEMAGVSTRHYSRIFKGLTGKSPIDYLIELRMNKAKRLLQSREVSVGEVAGSVGFHDPFHFSRSFKQHTGVSPRLYINLRKHSSRIASLQYLGELLALGIKPVGAPSQLLKGRYLQGHVEGITEIGKSVVTPYLDRLATLKPDVILTFDGHHYDTYAKIAPTLDMSWSQPVFDRFRFIADLIGKQQEAEQWLSQYEEQTFEARNALKWHLQAGHTLSFIWTRGLPETVQVYYDMKVLYQDLGFQAPAPVAAVQKTKGHPFKSNIPVQELPHYVGDHLFVVVSPDPVSQQHFRELRQTEIWNSLPAVQNRRVYLGSEDWLREDPVSMSGQIREAVPLLVELN